jgi:hypothetical protein
VEITRWQRFRSAAALEVRDEMGADCLPPESLAPGGLIPQPERQT